MDIYELVRSNDPQGIRERDWSLEELNRQTPEGTTPLILAAMLGYDKAARALKEKGADTSIRDNTGRSAVDHAAKNGHCLVIISLIDSGCGG